MQYVCAKPHALNRIEVDIGPAGSRAMHGLGYIRARAGSRCARIFGTVFTSCRTNIHVEIEYQSEALHEGMQPPTSYFNTGTIV